MIRVENKLGFTWITLPDSISGDDYRIIENEISGLLTEENRLVLDLIETNNIYSSGLGLLIRLNKMAVEKKGVLHLVNVSPKLREVFSLVNLDKYFSMYETDIEFQVLHEEAWKHARLAEPIGFFCFQKIENGVCHVHLSGKMIYSGDIARLHGSLINEKVDFFVYDMIGLDIMDVASADLLVRAITDTDSRGGKCLAFGVNDIVKDLLIALHKDLKLQFFDTEAEALKSIGK